MADFCEFAIQYGNNLIVIISDCITKGDIIRCFAVWKLFKGSFYYCQGPNVRDVYNKSDCTNKPTPPYKWVRHKYNFDDLGQVSFKI